MGDRARAHMLAWPMPANLNTLSGDTLAALAAFVDQHDPLQLQPVDWPGERWDDAVGVYQHTDGTRVFYLTDREANYGTCAFTDLIKALRADGLNVVAENDMGGNYGACREYRLNDLAEDACFDVLEYDDDEAIGHHTLLHLARHHAGMPDATLDELPDEAIAAVIRQRLNPPRLPAAVTEATA